MKLWTTFHDDPKVQNLSDKAFRYYVNALSWCGHHDRDGIFECIGKPPKFLEELIASDLFIPQVDGYSFYIHGWDKRQISREDMERKRAAGKKAADARWTAERNATPHANRMHAAVQVPNAKVEVEEQVKGEKNPAPAARARDELFDSLAEATGRNPYEMTRTDQRATATALADIKRATGWVTAAEIQARAENYRLHMPQVTLTPSALAKHWAMCAKPPTAAPKLKAARGLALADQLEAQGR